MSAKKVTKKKTNTNVSTKGFSDFEKAAMKELLKERKASANKEEWEKEVLSKIAEMPEPDRSMAKRIHVIVKANAPTLSPKTWYGMPAYANDQGKAICFFQAADKFKARYATFGFSDSAKLDEGAMWATSFALKKMTAAEEAKITALVKKAAG